jgi:phenylacetate-CoA ligase
MSRVQSNQTLTHMRSSVDGMGWPPVIGKDVAPLAALSAKLEQTQWLPTEQLQIRQFHQLRILLAHVAEHSPFFRDRLARTGVKWQDACTLEGFLRLPVIKRRDIQTAGAGLYCTRLPPAHRPVAETRTSGSTGEPVVIRRTGMNQLFWMALNLRDHLWHRRDFALRFSAIRAQIENYLTRDDWGPPVSMLFASGPFQGIPLSASIAEQWKWLSEFQPNILLVYPSNLDALIQHARDHSASIPSIRQIRTIGETLYPRTRELAAEVLSAKVADCYSSQEAGNIAIECPESPLYHICAENLIVEVLDEAGRPCVAGGTGRVVLTDLHNFATPLIRYDVGDYAEVGPACPCGRGLPTLRRILGRERNLIVLPDGSRRWPLVGFAHFREIAPIYQFQFIQHERELIEVRLQAASELSSQQEAALTEVIHKALGHAFGLRFTYFPAGIPRSAGGKFEEFICKVTPKQA